MVFLFIYYFRVRMDIINSLKMRDPNVFIGSFDRKNLFYGVKSFIRNSQFMDEFVGEISKFVASSDSTIIYCTTIKDVEQVHFLYFIAFEFTLVRAIDDISLCVYFVHICVV